MSIEIFTVKQGEVWKGKLDQIPRVGDRICVNNKKHYGYYIVQVVLWNVDWKQVLLRCVEE